jgi:predicted nucleic acid-binding protein
MLNAKLHHPEQIKRAAIGNTIKTYTSICSTDALFEEAERKFERRALRNGYSNNYIKKVQTTKRKLPKSKVEPLPTFTSRSLTFHSFPDVLPLTSEERSI